MARITRIIKCENCGKEVEAHSGNMKFCPGKTCFKKGKPVGNEGPRFKYKRNKKNSECRERNCLRCDKKFTSTGFNNRLCPICGEINGRRDDTKYNVNLRNDGFFKRGL